MLKIEKQSNNLFTINCYLYNQKRHCNEFLYTVNNIPLTRVASYMQGRGDSYCSEDIKLLFETLPNLNQAYVSEDGRVTAVAPR